MELWIRSQDKRCLMKADRLDIDLGNGAYKIYLGGYGTLVGVYKTYSRAEQIIDEIQNLLQPRYFIKDRTNWRTQVRWGCKYIKARYGTPSKAWEHSQKKGWY